MDFTCWAVPIKPGATELARAYCKEMGSARRDDFEASQEVMGIEREVFFLLQDAGRDYLILFMQGKDMAESIRRWEAADGPFEVWGKDYWEQFSEAKDWPRPLGNGAWSPPLLEMLVAYDKDLVQR